MDHREFRAVVKSNETGSILRTIGPYDAQTMCYALDQEVNLETENFTVHEDVSSQFIEKDGYWRHEPLQ